MHSSESPAARAYGKVTPQSTVALMPPVIASVTPVTVAPTSFGLSIVMVPSTAQSLSVEPFLVTSTV